MSADIELSSDGIPILDAIPARRNAASNGHVLVTTVQCPFCGYRHHHNDIDGVRVGSLHLRPAHCPDYDRKGQPVVKPARGYYLRIALDATGLKNPRK